MSNRDVLKQEEYQYGFHDEDVSVYKTKKGLREETIREISSIKQEPEWMLDFRLKAYRQFESMPLQDWGPSAPSSTMIKVRSNCPICSLLIRK